MPSELTALIRVDGVSSFGCRRHNAISSALITNSVSMRCPMDQPITCLENRSMELVLHKLIPQRDLEPGRHFVGFHLYFQAISDFSYPHPLST